MDLAAQMKDFAAAAARLEEEVHRRVVGQDRVIREILICLLAGGHALLEGAPGLGKTLLVRTLAACVDLDFSRIQFTPDLMPADVTGTNVIVEESDGAKAFRFQRGPIFGNLVLADEINRATPKTQSALLEAMQERSGDDRSARRLRARATPFFVLATQNPIEMEGTYPLPEAQLDRFMLQDLHGEPGRGDDGSASSSRDRSDDRARRAESEIQSVGDANQVNEMRRHRPRRSSDRGST